MIAILSSLGIVYRRDYLPGMVMIWRSSWQDKDTLVV